MQKKWIVLTVALVLLTTVVAANGVFEVIIPNKFVERAYSPISTDAQSSVDDAMYVLLQEIYEGEELWDATECYAEFKLVDKPSQEEVDAVYSAVAKTRNVFESIKVYGFWERTNDGIDIYTGIMDKYTPELNESEYWYENVYNELTNNANGVLDSEQVRQYLDDGISAEDIAVSNILSRRGVRTITEILGLRTKGKNWAQITEDLFEEYDYDDSHSGILAMDVINAAYLVKRTDKSMSDYFDIAIEEGSLVMEKQKYFVTETKGIREKLIEANLWDYSEEEKRNMEIKRQGILQTAQANGVTPEEFTELEEKGVPEMDILNASLRVKDKGLTLDQAVAELSPQEGVVEQ